MQTDPTAAAGGTPLSRDQQLAYRYALASKDMEEAIDYLDSYAHLSKLHEVDDNPQWAKACHGLLCAAIVAYCRPFLDSRSEGFATKKLPITQIQAIKGQKALHQLLIEKRNTFIAHADWSARSVQLTQVSQSTTTWDFAHPLVWDGLDVGQVRPLVEAVRRDCIRKAMAKAQVAHAIKPNPAWDR